VLYQDGGEKLEEQLAEASEEGLGSKGAVVPMMMMLYQVEVLYQT